ncbi:hypothetical protein [Embleya sp. AB8]|uniref:hypothetical protein n=1 Tax=Embleya sp. AB8 TaxID=3156304 RepID=UPI003C751DE7
MTAHGLTAAASRYTSRKIKAKPVDQSWQSAAWTFYSSVPEVRFVSTWIGNAMGGASLYAGYLGDDGTIERAPDGHRATEMVASIAGGPDGQSQLLRRFGSHLFVPGEGWIIIEPQDDARPPAETWSVLSVKEVKQQSGKLVAEIRGEPTDIPAPDPDAPIDDTAPIAIRVWEPHPERYLEADSPIRSSLDLLEELQLLTAAVKAIARSRLTGRGILFVPKGTRFPTSGVQGASEDDLIDVLMEIASVAIKEPESAAATVPIILEVPAETIGAFQLLKFDSDFDDLASKLREEAIRRFATGVEIPAEILLGLGDVNHWGVWALTSEAIRLGIEPRLRTVTHALTTQWMRPILEGENVADAERWVIAADTSPLRVRTNRSETAIKLYELGAIGGRAVRREAGFDEDDAPTPEEIAERARQNQDQAEQPGTSGGELPVDETTAEPDTLPAAAFPPVGVSEGLLAAADGLIWAALSAAGEKLRRTPACPRSERSRAREVDAAAVHTLLSVSVEQVEQWGLLQSAWTRVPEIAARYGLAPDCLTASLDSYCRELVAAGVHHSYDVVPAAISSCTQLAVAA